MRHHIGTVNSIDCAIDEPGASRRCQGAANRRCEGAAATPWAVLPSRAHAASGKLVLVPSAGRSLSTYLPVTRDRVILMVVGRANRRDTRAPRARELFGENAEVALDLLELMELAWHDCYAEVSPSDEVIEDVWIVSEGQLPKLVQAAKLAVKDFRDLRMNADGLRGIS